MRSGPFLRLLPVALLALAPAFATTGCGGDDLTEISNIVENLLASTRADEIMTTVDTVWFEPTGTAINPGFGVFRGPRLFRASTGAAVYTFFESADGTGSTLDTGFLFLGVIAADGTMYQPTRIEGDYTQADEETVQVVFNQHGDASVTFYGIQPADPSTGGDTDPDASGPRVYYTYIRVDQASQAESADGLLHGVNPTATAVDRNTQGTDEDDVESMFVASNLLLGTHSFDGISNSLDEQCSGAHGLADNDDITWFLGFGWGGIDSTDTDDHYFLEIAFVDLDTTSETYLELGTATELDVEPELDDTQGDSIDFSTLMTSGRDIFFVADITDNGNGLEQEFPVLVRVNDDGDGVDTAIGLNRGAGTTSDVTVDDAFMVGGGFTPFHGQVSTWVWFVEAGMTDGDEITNDDDDLIIVRVDDSGTGEIDEFDVEASDSADANPCTILTFDFARSLTHGVIYVTQGEDASAAFSLSLFAIGVIFTDGASSDFSDAITDPTRVNTDVDDTEGDTDIAAAETPDLGSACFHDSDWLGFGVTYVQDLDDDPDIDTLNLAIVTFSSVTQDPSSAPTLAVSDNRLHEQEVSWGSGYTGSSGSDVNGATIHDAGNGGFVAFFSAQGNNATTPTELDAFTENRLFIAAIGIGSGGDDLAATEVGSGVLDEDLPFPDFRTTVDHMAVGTASATSPDRDFEFDEETLAPDRLHLLLTEYTASPGLTAETIRYRTFDLSDGTFASVEDRFFPALTEAPSDVSIGDEDTDVTALLTQDDNALLVFREGPETSESMWFVTTLTTSSLTWVTPAVFTNDNIDPDLFLEPVDVWTGWATDSCCPQIIGGWAYWIRDVDDDRLQARRLIGTTMSDSDH